jgi:hypothetical protein
MEKMEKMRTKKIRKGEKVGSTGERMRVHVTGATVTRKIDDISLVYAPFSNKMATKHLTTQLERNLQVTKPDPCVISYQTICTTWPKKWLAEAAPKSAQTP